MYKVTKVMTNDGEMFDTEKEAKHYLEARYADCLCKLASKLVSIEKYQPMCEFLDANIDTDLFERVKDLKKEIAKGIENEEE